MTTSDVLIQRVAKVVEQLEDELFGDDERDLRLFRDWLQLYRAQRRHQLQPQIEIDDVQPEPGLADSTSDA